MRVSIIIMGIIIISGSLSAQPPIRGERNKMQGEQRPMFPDSSHIVEMVNELDAELSLTAEQKTQITQLHFAHFNEAKQHKEIGKEDRENHRQKMDALRKEFEEQVKAVLTKEQQEQFEAFMKTRGPKKRHQQKTGNKH